MSFALKKARFWRDVKRMIVVSLPFEPKKDDSKD